MNRYEREAKQAIARMDSGTAPDTIYPVTSKPALRLIERHYKRIVKGAKVDLVKAEQAVKDQTYVSLVGAGRTPATALEAKYTWIHKFNIRYHSDDEKKDNDFKVFSQAFEGAEVYTVAPHIHSMFDRAAATLPDESSLSSTDIPFGSGLIFGTRKFLDVYDALGWVNIALPENDGFLLAILGYKEFEHDRLNSFFFPLVATYYDKPLSYLDEQSYAEDVLQVEDVFKLRKFIASFFYFVNQRVFTTTHERADRATRKRLQREGKNSEQAIQVIQLRASAPHGSAPTGNQVEWSTRWIVRGHWRNQPYGPAHSLVKPIWIAPYVKGPDDKPIKVSTHLFEVSR